MGHRIAMHVVYRMASFYEDHARDHVRALGRRRTRWGAGKRERTGAWNIHFTSTMCINLEWRALLLIRNYAYYCMACQGSQALPVPAQLSVTKARSLFGSPVPAKAICQNEGLQ